MKMWRVVPVAIASAILATALSAQPAATAPLKATVPSATPRVPKVPLQGNPNTHFVRVGATEFAFDSSSSTFDLRDWDPSGGNLSMVRYLTGGYPHVYAFAHIPGGALLTYVELDYCDTNASNHLTLDVYDCDYHGNCSTPTLTTLTSTNAGCSDEADGTLTYTMNNYDNEVLLDVTFGAGDGSNALGGVIIGWQYQVSPAPGTATFNDVPTADPAFRWIEAFASAGITAGCSVSPPLYCPDNTVTRRQMAVFFAKALGLFWGGY